MNAPVAEPTAPSPLPTLETARLRLRPYRADDARAIFAVYSDPQVTRYWSFPAWTDLAQAHAYLAQRQALEAPSVLAWAVADRASDQLVGTTTLFSLNGPQRRAEIGYSLARSQHGRGLAAEALRAAIAHAFAALALERIEADVDPRNEKSWQLLERLGFRREGRLRNRWRVDGEVCDSYIYGLLRDEFVAGDA
jgi:[ribosomal protein S5]-alanine N-acetyltransferase